jgi:hypothetical protein
MRPPLRSPAASPDWVSSTPACATHKTPSLAYPGQEEAKPFDDLTAARSGTSHSQRSWAARPGRLSSRTRAHLASGRPATLVEGPEARLKHLRGCRMDLVGESMSKPSSAMHSTNPAATRRVETRTPRPPARPPKHGWSEAAGCSRVDTQPPVEAGLAAASPGSCCTEFACLTVAHGAAWVRSEPAFSPLFWLVGGRLLSGLGGRLVGVGGGREQFGWLAEREHGGECGRDGHGGDQSDGPTSMATTSFATSSRVSTSPKPRSAVEKISRTGSEAPT